MASRAPQPQRSGPDLRVGREEAHPSAAAQASPARSTERALSSSHPFQEGSMRDSSNAAQGKGQSAHSRVRPSSAKWKSSFLKSPFLLLKEHEATRAGKEPVSRKPWEQDGADKATLGKTTNNSPGRALPITWLPTDLADTAPLHWQEPQERQEPGSHQSAADPTSPHPGERARKWQLQTRAVSMPYGDASSPAKLRTSSILHTKDPDSQVQKHPCSAGRASVKPQVAAVHYRHKAP